MRFAMFSLLAATTFVLGDDPMTNLAQNARATASSTHQNFTAEKAIDGVVSNDSRWISASQPGPHTLAIEWDQPTPIGCLQLVSGWSPSGAWIQPVKDFRFECRQGGEWLPIPAAAVAGNASHAWECRLQEPLTTDAVRLVALDNGYVRVAEIRV
ncbi:MAG: discoidin domain-containing protein, partial [Lentisphaeria bacterium]|nr:discoidin domain-containing protein [Lentisphaeria bacterium]